MALAPTDREQLDPQVQAYIAELETEIAALSTKTETLSEQNSTLSEKNEALSEEVLTLEEKLRLALFKRFGRSSEHGSNASGQGDLFTEADDTAETTADERSDDTITVASHTKKKPAWSEAELPARPCIRGRKPIDPKHPRFERVIDIDDQDKQCACGHEMVRIGEEVTERV